MRNLLKLILRQHFVLLFLLIQSASLLIAFNNNYFLRTKFFNFSRSFSVMFYKNVNELDEYLHLKTVNENLAAENEELKNKLEFYDAVAQNNPIRYYGEDTIVKYRYITAKVINNSTNKQFNYITLNKGSKEGIKPDMVVTSFNGIVGKVEAVNNHFSVITPILNKRYRLSTRIKGMNYAGSLAWTGKGTKYANFTEIPEHVEINIGDTVETSGYSEYYPEGILVGVIEDYVKEGNFYSIKVKLAANFENLSYVTVIAYLLKEEQEILENSVQYD